MKEQNRHLVEFFLEYIKKNTFFRVKYVISAYLDNNYNLFELKELNKICNLLRAKIRGYISLIKQSGIDIKYNRNARNGYLYKTTPEFIIAVEELLNEKKYPFMKTGTYEIYRERYLLGLERNNKLKI